MQGASRAGLAGSGSRGNRRHDQRLWQAAGEPPGLKLLMHVLRLGTSLHTCSQARLAAHQMTLSQLAWHGLLACSTTALGQHNTMELSIMSLPAIWARDVALARELTA